MKLEVRSLRGESGKPACVFVPGLGMDSSIWAAPSEARILGGLFSIGGIYKDQRLRTLYADLAKSGYPVFTWGPKRPVGPAAAVVKELHEVIDHAAAAESSGIVLIGHSRGGLAARIALPELLERGVPIKALVTIASPHHGSSMARWASFLAPFASFVGKLLPEGEKKAFTSAIKRALEFLSSAGVKEHLPDSELITSLPDEKPGDIYCLSVGGSNPTLVESRYFSIPGTFEKVLPAGALPDEMKEGKGDCLVTDESAVLPFADEHLTFHKNHLKILLDAEVREEILKRIIQIG